MSFPGADFDGDGRRDLLWEHTDGQSEIWLMNGSRGDLRGAGTGWSVKALGDFDGNGKTDIVWEHTDGSSEIWLMDGVTMSVVGNILGAGTGWSVKDVGNFQGNGKSDMVWQHTDGSTVICLMHGITGSCRYVLGVDTGWSVRTIGDFEGNGNSDILLQHTDGSTAIWFMNGFTVSALSSFDAGTGWSVKALGDFDGDGKSDILWQHADGNSTIWLMNGEAGGLRGAGTDWSAKALGDFDGDGKSDILWEHKDGSTEMWLMNGVAMTIGGNILGAGTGWSVKDVGDFDGDLRSDILWRHADGAVTVWLMNGLSMTGSSVLVESGTGWVPGPLPTPEETSPPPPPPPPPAPAPNSAPVVNAGADQSITLPAAAILNGTAHDDGLPAGSLTTTWSLLSGPAPVSFGSPANLSTSATFSAPGTYTLRLTAMDSALTASDDIVIVVNGASLPAPTVSLSASTNTITSGQSVTLTWSSTNSTSCDASGGWSGAKELAGSVSVSPNVSSTYMLSCSGSSGTAVQSATVAVNAVMTYDFSFGISGPTHVVQGHSLYLLLDLALLSGTRDYVNFSVAGLPSGAAASFPDLEAYCCGPTRSWEPSPDTLRITTTHATPQGSYPLTVIATSGGITKMAAYLIHVDSVPLIAPPIPITGFLTIPSVGQWESNMTVYAQKHCATLQDSTLTVDQRLGATYYDAERMYYQIAAHTGSPMWNVCAQAAERVYRDDYVMRGNGGVPGYWNFTAGLRRDYELTGDTTSQSAAVMLSQQAAYTSGRLSSLISTATIREVSYAILSYIDAEKMDNPRNPRLQAYVDILLGYFDQFFVSKNTRCPGNCDPAAATGQYYVQPFMIALGGEALITYYREINPDPRIPVAVKMAADWLWTHAWYAPNRTFWYENFISDPERIPSGYWPPATVPTSADLNLLIAPVYAWLYRLTGDPTYRDQGDQVFEGGVANSWLDGVKQFNQSYRWSFDFVKWRSAN